MSGNTLTFAPAAYPFASGETVSYTVTTAAAGSGGAMARPRVGQFTTAAGGTGTGNFQPGFDIMSGSRSPSSVAMGDINGDGHLDMLVAGRSSTNVFTFLNNGTGSLAYSGLMSVGTNPMSVVMADVDKDGDLDALVANYNSGVAGTVSVRFNDGAGLFSGNQEVPANYGPSQVVAGDIDGDGDLDLLCANISSTVSVRLNNGSGNFSGTQEVSIGGNRAGASNIALGDVDGDGDLDFVASNSDMSSGTTSVRLNDGSGAFSNGQAVSIGTNPGSLALGDVDGDNDLDLLAANGSSGTVGVRLNNGSGSFAGNQDVSVGASPSSLALADVDADGDLDIVVTNAISAGTANVRRNNGSGSFSGSQSVAIGIFPSSLALADVDSDGDLDVLATNGQGSSASVRLNQMGLGTAPGLATATLALAPNPAREKCELTGAAPFATCTVLDALGRVVLSTTANAAGSAQLALPARLPAGVYLVRSGEQVRQLAVE